MSSSEQSLKDKVFSSSPAQLILLLMDAAVEALATADGKYCAAAYDEAIPFIDKARQITEELHRSVKPDVGELSVNMQTVYTSINVQLDKAVMQKDVSALENALRMMSELRDTWKTISR